MKLTNITFITTLMLTLVACSQSHRHTTKVQPSSHSQAMPITVDRQHKRINTTDCQDSDDWYLDGYRVGKSFSSQKNVQFQQRLAYCHFTHKQLPHQFKVNWEKGFAVGNKQPMIVHKNKYI